MNDDRDSTNERLAQAVRQLYHRPAATPSDEMWSVIDRRLNGGQVDDPAVVPIGPVSHRQSPGRTAWWVGIAAALVIGLGLGRLVRAPESPVTPMAGIVETPTDERDPAETPGEVADPPTELAAAGGDRRSRERSVPDTGLREGASRGNGGSVPFRVAALEHFGRSESLLQAVKTEGSAAAGRGHGEEWARSLLARTRILMESPAAEDRQMRRLLEDLELMLMQVVATTATEDEEEARILDRGLAEGDLLRRLRTATSTTWKAPASPPAPIL